MGFGQRDAESQQIMQQMSDDFVVDEESMKVLMDGEGFDEHLEKRSVQLFFFQRNNGS